MSTTMSRAHNAVDKMLWGVKVVGPGHALVGMLRLATVTVQRRPEAVVRLRSGPVLGFAYPRQMVPALVAFGDYIDPEIAFLRRVARHDWIVIDVGAAIGQFSVFAAMLPTAHVHAFEPSSDNIRTLEANLRRNHVESSVTIHQRALSHRDAEMVFPTLQNPYLSRLDRPGAPGSGETVAVRTLTGTLAELGLKRVDCLKINVSGYESEVIDGGQDFLLHQGADFLVILISEGSGPWFSRIAAMGYRFFYFHPPSSMLHEIGDIDDLSAHERPWPARHLIGVSGPGIERGVLDGVGIIPRIG